VLNSQVVILPHHQYREGFWYDRESASGIAHFRQQHIMNLRRSLTDKGIWNPSALATIAVMSIRYHIWARKLNQTPNLKEKVSVVRMRQHLDIIVGHDWRRNLDIIAPGRSAF